MAENQFNSNNENPSEERPDEEKVEASDVNDVRSDAEPTKSEQEPPKKPPRKISLFASVLSTVSLVLAAVMITYTLCTAAYKQKLNSLAFDKSPSGEEYDVSGDKIDLISQFIDNYTFEDVDEQKMMAAAIKAYVASTGDRYAEYFTTEEYLANRKESMGESEGIGITILEKEVEIRGQKYTVMRIANVIKNSPAAEAGLLIGDLVYSLKTEEGEKTVDELGFNEAIAKLKGAAGTFAEFTVYRPSIDEFIPCRAERKEIVSESVIYRVHSEDRSVGVVRILQFNLTTPAQFKAAMDDLIAKGCTNFVLDVRDNPGGDLLSIQAVLSYFLKEGDVMIRTLYKDGTEEFGKVAAVNYSGDYEGCSVSAEEIGKYSDDKYKYTVLCNGNTASAGELFTATFRDYDLGTVIGTVTYGKGSMQRYFSLASYGYSGVLKLTIAKYFSGANGGVNEGYDGVGITPHVLAELSPEAAEKSLYELTDAEDDQLKKALECFK